MTQKDLMLEEGKTRMRQPRFHSRTDFCVTERKQRNDAGGVKRLFVPPKNMYYSSRIRGQTVPQKRILHRRMCNLA
jgi:hypothetical protein